MMTNLKTTVLFLFLAFTLMVISVNLEVASVSGSTTDWPMYRFNAAHGGATSEVVYPPLNPKWSFTTDVRSSIAASVYAPPSVAAGIVYFGSENGNFYALDALTGALKWNYTTPWNDQWRQRGFSNSAPAVAGGLVYAGSLNGNLYAFDVSTGAVKWSYLTKGMVGSSPVVSEGIVYVGSYDHRLYALDASTGTVKWSYLTNTLVTNSPAVSGGIVYASGPKVYALNAATGALIWAFNATTNPMAHVVPFSSPAVSDGVVYVGAGDGNAYALNAATGAVIWIHNMGPSYIVTGSLFTDAAVSSGMVYIVSDNKMYALNAATGALIWSSTPSNNAYTSDAVVSGGVVYVGCSDRKMYALNAATGTVIWSGTVGGTVGGIRSYVVSNGSVYLSSEGNIVYALSGSVSPPVTTMSTISSNLSSNNLLTKDSTSPSPSLFLAISIVLGIFVATIAGYLLRKRKKSMRGNGMEGLAHNA
jgi:outer membrane protein assembly factor BamB